MVLSIDINLFWNENGMDGSGIIIVGYNTIFLFNLIISIYYTMSILIFTGL